MSIASNILKLTDQLYPTGRVFKMASNGYLYRIHRALAVGEAKAFTDANSVLNSILPDNDLFSADDATDWERRLGLVTNTATPLADRKLAIQRKMNHPGTIKARQHYKYLESQLQAAGFDVYVYENRFALYPTGYETKSPTVAFGTGTVPFQMGDGQFGDHQFGYDYYTTLRVVNYVDEVLDSYFLIGANYRSTFFIAGSSLTTPASVDINRKNEFRQLILKIKPVQTVALLNLNYV